MNKAEYTAQGAADASKGAPPRAFMPGVWQATAYYAGYNAVMRPDPMPAPPVMRAVVTNVSRIQRDTERRLAAASAKHERKLRLHAADKAIRNLPKGRSEFSPKAFRLGHGLEV